jgi:hypothetical protein
MSLQTPRHFLPALRRAWAGVRPACHAVITPHAVVLEASGRARPLVRKCSAQTGSVEAQFAFAVAGLLQLMDDSGAHGRPVRVVVSDSWARPLVLPLAGQKFSDAEVDVALQSQYRRVYGDLMSGWEWCWAQHGGYLFAAAWPQAGLRALREGLLQRNSVLAAAQPMVIDIAAKALVTPASQWLAIVEAQCVSLVRQQGLVWRDWCVVPLDARLAASWPTQLAREAARRSDDCKFVTVVDLCGTAGVAPTRQMLADAGWTLRVWSPAQADASVGYRLAQAMLLETSA